MKRNSAIHNMPDNRVKKKIKISSLASVQKNKILSQHLKNSNIICTANQNI